MKFAALLARTQRQTAIVFSPQLSGDVLRAWFPATASATPALRAEYTVEAGPATTGPLRSRTMEQYGLIGISGQLRGVLLSCPLPYEPDKSITTFLLGADRETATRHRIIEVRSIGSFLELDAEEIEPPLDTLPDA